jgi:predicted DNA-binding protein (MmcQ/YjbR family)
MDAELVREYCLFKKATTEDQPFGPDVLTFRIGGKIFLLLSLDAFPSQFNVKCDPERAIDLRATHTSIIPGYHMNKKHWNTVILDGTLSTELVHSMIDESYEIIFGSLPKKKRTEIESIEITS